MSASPPRADMLSVSIGIVRVNRLEPPGEALSEQNSKYLERPSNRSDRPGKMQENQWPRNPVLTFWQSKRICSDNALSRTARRAREPTEYPQGVVAASPRAAAALARPGHRGRAQRPFAGNFNLKIGPLALKKRTLERTFKGSILDCEFG
jgi:hypothetical protein